MFCLNIALGNTSWRLLFKDADTAKVAFTILDSRNDPDIKIEDDFGQTLVAHVDSMHGLMLEDLDKTKMAHVEMALHQERTKVLAQNMAQTDPALKAASARQGPAIIAPMGNGARPF